MRAQPTVVKWVVFVLPVILLSLSALCAITAWVRDGQSSLYQDTWIKYLSLTTTVKKSDSFEDSCSPSMNSCILIEDSAL